METFPKRRRLLISKHEIRNSKQFLMFKIQTGNAKTFLFESSENWDFGFVSDFDIRISNFWKPDFLASTQFIIQNVNGMKVLLIDPPHKLFPGLRMWTLLLVFFNWAPTWKKRASKSRSSMPRPFHLHGEILETRFQHPGQTSSELRVLPPVSRGGYSGHLVQSKAFTELHHCGRGSHFSLMAETILRNCGN